MNFDSKLIIGLTIGVGVIGYLLTRSKKERIEKHRRIHALPEGPARDVYSGDYIDPIKPRWPYNAHIVKPHRDIYSGKLVSNHDPYPSQPKEKAREFIINKIINEFKAEGRLDPKMTQRLHATIKSEYMDEIKWIARNNLYKYRPLHGEVLSKYSTLMLKIADNHMLFLSPSARARYTAQQYYSPRHSLTMTVHHTGVAISEEDE